MGVTTIANSLGRPGYALTMPGTENTVPDVRAVVRAIAHVWEMSDLADDAVLVVSELVTNAVKHTDTILLRVTVNRPEPHVIRIEVSDRSPQPPTPRCPGDTEEGGRGLALVEALTSRWGTEPTRKGKRVWGELRSTT